MPIPLKPERVEDTKSYKIWSALDRFKTKFNIPTVKEEKSEDIGNILKEGIGTVSQLGQSFFKTVSRHSPTSPTKSLLAKTLFSPPENPVEIIKERSAALGERRELQPIVNELQSNIESELFQERPFLSPKKAKEFVKIEVGKRLLERGIFSERPRGLITEMIGNYYKGATLGVSDTFGTKAIDMARSMKNPYTMGEKITGGVGQLAGGFTSYGALAARVGIALKTIPALNKMAKTHQFLFEAGLQNLGEEAIDFSIRRGTQQVYGTKDFLMGMGFGGIASTLFIGVKGLRDMQLGPVQDQLDVEIKTFLKEQGRYPDFETDLMPRIENTKMAGSDLTYGEALQMSTKENRLIFLKGGKRGVPGIDLPDDVVIRPDGQPEVIAKTKVQRQIEATTGIKKARKVVRKQETTLLKDKFKAEARGARRAFIASKRSIQEVQKEAAKYAKVMLPKAERGLAISAIRKATTQKGLQKSIIRMNEIVENMNRRDWIGDIKSIAKPKFLTKIPVDAQEEILDLLAGYSLVKPTTKTKNLAEEILAQVDAGTEGLSHKSLDIVDRVGKPQIADLETPELKGLLDRVSDILDSAKHKSILDKLESSDQVKAMVQSLEPELKSSLKKTRLGKVGKTVWLANREYMTPDRFFDMRSGYKGYKGKVFNFFKKPIDVAYRRFANMLEDSTSGAEVIIKKNNLKAANMERIGQFGLWNRVDGSRHIGREKLNLIGVDSPPTLTAKETELYDYMRGEFDKIFPNVKKTLAKSENKLISKNVENYWPMVTDKAAKLVDETGDEITSVKEIMADNGFNFSTKTEAGFTEKAVGGLQAVEVDASKTFARHMEDALYFTNMQDPLDKIKSVIDFRIPSGLEGAGKQPIRQAFGDDIEYVERYLNTIATDGAATGAGRLGGVMKTLRNNTSIGVMAAKASVAIKQPLALMNAIPLLGDGIPGQGGYRLIKSMHRVGFLPAGKLPFARVNKNIQFILENSAELRLRQQTAGESALYQLSKEGAWLEKVPGYKATKTAGFYPLRKLDSLSAMAVWDASYTKNKFKMSKEDAITEADRLVRLTQASGLSKDSPFVIQRGETARFIHQFQSFVINDWNLISHDMIRSGLLRGGGADTALKRSQKRMQAVSLAFFMYNAAMLEDYISTGFDWEEASEGGPLGHIAQKIPIVKNIQSFQKFGGTTVPALDSVFRAAGAGGRLASPSTSDKARKSAMFSFLSNAGSVVGIPGAGQISKTLRESSKKSQKTGGKRRSTRFVQ